MRKVVLSIICIVLGLQACTHENLDECFFGLRLKVAYLLPYGNDNTPAPSVHHAKAYVFNEQGVLCAVGEGKGDCLSAESSIDINLSPGKYKVLVWGSDAMDLLVPYKAEATIGKTAFSDFQLSLKGEINEAATEFIPEEAAFSDLYYGLAGKRTAGTSEYVLKEVVIPEQTIVEETVELIRNTNQLNITIEDFQNLVPGWTTDNTNIEMYVLGKGETYDKDNNFVSNNYKVKYTPYKKEIKDNRFLFNLKTQRIRRNMQNVKPLMLYIYDKSQGKSLYELDVLEALLKVHNGEDNYLYSTQQDLDRIYSHNIKLKIESSDGIRLVIKVFIDDWEIVNMYPVS